MGLVSLNYAYSKVNEILNRFVKLTTVMYKNQISLKEMKTTKKQGKNHRLKNFLKNRKYYRSTYWVTWVGIFCLMNLNIIKFETPKLLFICFIVINMIKADIERGDSYKLFL